MERPLVQPAIASLLNRGSHRGRRVVLQTFSFYLWYNYHGRSFYWSLNVSHTVFEDVVKVVGGSILFPIFYPSSALLPLRIQLHRAVAEISSYETWQPIKNTSYGQQWRRLRDATGHFQYAILSCSDSSCVSAVLSQYHLPFIWWR